MKRSRLKTDPEKLKAWRKRSAKPLKQTKLKPVSQKQQKALKAYQSTEPMGPRNWCCKCGEHQGLERHHPKGRGNYIDQFIMLCHWCHEWVHANANEAYDLGWLQPEYRGLPHNPNHPTPWI